MYVNFIAAQELPSGGPVAGKRRFRLLTADDHTYVAKSAWCPKITSQLNRDFYLAAWLANELVYWEFVRNSLLRVPPVVRLTLAEEPFVGSEYLKTRSEVRDSIELARLVRISQDNMEQATMALVFDLALLKAIESLPPYSRMKRVASGSLITIRHYGETAASRARGTPTVLS